ncbi:Bromodomain-containing protein 8 [Linnemannia zychae]|nr:Bromodomain-containing protein 8 [Linnemannia zychae]
MSDVTTSTDIKSDSEPWSILENLILAQAIYKCGDTNWVAIAHIPSVVKLAGQLYNQRILEIKALIRKDEERFRSLVAELDDIRQGKWDSQLEEELKKNPPPPEPEQESEANTSDLPATSVENSQQSVREGESLQNDTTAPSSLSSPSSSVLSEKLEETTQSMHEDVPTMEQPIVAAASNIEVPSENQTEDVRKDVEMEDVGESESTVQTPKVLTPTAITSGDVPVAVVVSHEAEDIEMEDITSTESLSVMPEISTSTSTPVEDTKPHSTQDLGSNLKISEVNTRSIASSPTSASDLSPPGAMEEEEDEEDESETSKKETEAVSPAADEEAKDSGASGKDSQAREYMPIKEEMDMEVERSKEKETDIDVDRELEPESKNTPSNFSEGGDDSKVDEDVTIKLEDVMNDTEHEFDTEKDGHDEGATSIDEGGEEGETVSTPKSPMKPRKIKTSIPAKRKRRSGRGGADIEEGYNTTDSEATESVSNMSDHRSQMDDKKWKKILMMIWADIANHRYGAVFMQPIKEQDAPGYYYMIKRPMDLKSIKERIRDGQITNADEFHRDVLLMFMNALMYNGEDTEVYQMALAMMTEVEQIIKNFKSSQSFGPTSTSGGAGSGSASVSTTPTTRTAGSDILSGVASGSSSSRRRKSSGMETTPAE